MAKDLTELLLNDQDAFLAEVSADIAQRVGRAAVEQEARQHLNATYPELATPENEHFLNVEMQQIVSANPNYQGGLTQLIDEAARNIRGRAAAQRAANERAERERTAEENRQAAAEAQQENDLNFAQYMMDTAKERARTTGESYTDYSAIEVGLRSLPKEPTPEDAELDAYVREQNRPVEELKAIHAQQSRDGMKVMDERRNRVARGLPPMTDAQEIDYARKHRG